ncbi:UbiA family prenyltransferase [Nannocystaceae bacterium ST9]
MESSSPPGRHAVALASLRTPQWLHFSVLPLAALGSDDLLAPPSSWLRVLVGCLIAAGCLGFAYGINAVAERHSDRSAAKNPLVAAPEQATHATMLALVVGLLALGLAALLGTWALLAAALSLICGATYSVGVAGKHVPVLGLVLNTGIFAPLTALLLRPDLIPPSWPHELAVFVLLLIQNQLIHELADYDEDRAAGARTTARLLRRRGTIRVAVLAGFAVPLASIALAPSAGQALLSSAIAAVATLIAFEARRDPARSRQVHRAVAFAGGALLWLFARVVG